MWAEERSDSRYTRIAISLFARRYGESKLCSSSSCYLTDFTYRDRFGSGYIKSRVSTIRVSGWVARFVIIPSADTDDTDRQHRAVITSEAKPTGTNSQCLKCLMPVKTIARLCSSAAAITSSSRTDPPG
jgi:hypothetical protein